MYISCGDQIPATVLDVDLNKFKFNGYASLVTAGNNSVTVANYTRAIVYSPTRREIYFGTAGNAIGKANLTSMTLLQLLIFYRYFFLSFSPNLFFFANEKAFAQTTAAVKVLVH